jgi:curved DNA-binding protein CbpA
MALDYYEILGVPPKADAGEIKKAYRQLAQKWHPDKNPGDPWATGRFMRLGEAYRVLMDPVRRAAYDWLRTQESQSVEDSPPPRQFNGNAAAPEQSPPRQPPGPPRGCPYNRGPSRARRRKYPRQPRGSAPKLAPAGSGGLFPWLLSFKYLPQRFLNWLTGRLPAGLEWEMVPVPHRPDLVMDLVVPGWLAARGARLNFILRSHGQRQRLRVTIPAGVQEGLLMKVKGGGRTEGPVRGNLYINIRIKNKVKSKK